MSQTSTPNSSWKGLPSWLSFAFLIVAPPVPIVVFARSLTQNPFLIGLFVFIYEIILFVLRFTGKVWALLEDSLVKYIAHWVTIRTQEFLSRPYRTYYQYLIYEHQIFDVKGLSTRTAHDLELEQVFVDLRISPIAAHKASVNPLHSANVPEKPQGAYSIWDYLSTPAPANSHLVILGAPGSGKTTLLKHLAITLAQPRKYPHRQRMRHRFPILLFLHDHAHAISEHPDFSLSQALQEHIEHTWQQNIPATWINQHLNRGTCLILLDGLDEVADINMRKQVVVWVQRQLIAYGHNRFILTSRPHGYQENPIEGVTVLDVQAFTHEQTERFIQNWYLANELKSWGKDDPGMRLRASEGARDLMARLYQADALLAFAVNPLLLTMIATVHRYRNSLPGKRVELYSEVCEVFLGKRHEARGIVQDLSPIQKQQVLQQLAYVFMQQGKREMTSNETEQVIAPALSLVSAQMLPTDFLRVITTTGVLLEPKPDHYGFAHKTFQEYLAAVYIKQKGLEQELAGHVAESWWHETIRLYCAQADATVLILACLASKPFTVSSLTLALECDEEKLEIQPHAQTQLTQMLNKGAEDRDSEYWSIIVEALIKRRMRHMIHLNEEAYMDISLVTCAEYQFFVDDQQKQDLYYQPSHWTDYYFASGQGHDPILGICPTEALAFCSWLTRQDPEHWCYRLPHKDELEEIEETLRKKGKLVTGTGYWFNEGETLVQVKGSPPLSKSISEESLEASFSRDYQQIRAYPLNTGDAGLQELAECLSCARDLAQLRYLVDQLVRLFHATRESLRSTEANLQEKLKQACVYRQKLENDLRRLAEKKASQMKKYEDASRHIQRLTRNSPVIRISSSSQVDDLRSHLYDCERQLHHILALQGDRQAKFEQACQDEHTSKEDLSNFHTRTSHFSTRFDNLQMEMEPLYEKQKALSLALARNSILNLDHIFDNTWYLSLKAVITYLDEKYQPFIQEIISLYNGSYQDVCDDKSKNTHFKKIAFALNQLLNNNTIYDSATRLGNLLKYYVDHFSNRHYFAGKGRLTRLAIRYFAMELANYLLYWSWKASFVHEKQEQAINQQCLDAFSDIAVGFTILEERIEGKIPVYEGILLVKEREMQ